jgi:Zn-dependent protease with chaperone function
MVEVNQKQRPNPFSFASETRARFFLLVALILTLAWTLSRQMIWVSLFEEQWLADKRSEGELEAFAYKRLNPVYEVGKPITQEHVSDFSFWIQLGFRMIDTELGWFLISLPILFLVSIAGVVLYLLHPIVVENRLRARLPSEAEESTLAEEVAALSRSVGIVQAPTVKITGLLAGAQVYGLDNKYVIAVGNEPRFQRVTKPADFRAIVLHELAHIANGDVSPTYLNQAYWIVGAAIIVLPFILILVFRTFFYLKSGVLNRLLPNTIKLTALALILKLISNSVLRVRELYADWRAAWWGAAESLENILERGMNSLRTKSRQFLYWFGVQPSMAERRRTLGNPERLFHVRPDLCLMVGISAGFALALIFAFEADFEELKKGAAWILQNLALLRYFGPKVGLKATLGDVLFVDLCNLFGATIEEIITLVPFFGLSLLISGTLGIQAQRAAMFERISPKANRRRLATQAILSFLVAVGFEVGYSLDIGRLFYPPDFPSIVSAVMVGLISLTPMVFIWLEAVRLFSRFVYPTHIGANIPRGLQVYVTLNSALFLLFFLAPAYNIRLLMSGWSPEDFQWNYSYFVEVATYCTVGAFLQACAVSLVGLFQQFWHMLFPLRCPRCQTPVRRLGLTRGCPGCGSPLAEWLFVPERGQKPA